MKIPFSMTLHEGRRSAHCPSRNHIQNQWRTDSSRYEKETNPYTKFNIVIYSQIPENRQTENRSGLQRQKAAISSLAASLTSQT